MAEVYIMQGLPGSGKSWHAKKLAERNDFNIVSADLYFQKNGEYKFDPKELPNAHKWCYAQYLRLINESRNVIVDNTNLTVAEVAPYYRLPEIMDWCYKTVQIIRVDTAFSLCLERQTHGVPFDRMYAMYQNFMRDRDRLPPWWKVVTLTTTH